jgi:hypothetical protein
LTLTLESVLTSAAGFGLATASPLQRAICRIADGLPLGDLAEHPDVLAAIACSPSVLPLVVPRELYLLSGIRCGKSLFAAALAIRATQTVDVSGLGRGEVPRVSVLALALDSAKPILNHIDGALRSPALAALKLSDVDSEGVTLRHPSGRPVEIRVVAGARAGGSLVSRWSAGAIFDEAPRMVGGEDGVVNFDHGRDAVLGRLLPNAQLVALGSPWAPFGPVYDTVQEHWGKPSEHRVVVRGTGPTMNPGWWTPERAGKLLIANPVAYRTDVLGEFADPEGGLLAPEDLDAVKITEAPPVNYGWTKWVAAMDPSSGGSKRNGWTLVVAAMMPDRTIVIGHAVEYRGLSPDETLAKVAVVLARYGITQVLSDQYAATALIDLAKKRGFRVVQHAATAATKLQQADDFAALVTARKVNILDHAGLLSDLRSVRRRLTANGAQIVYPRTTDGRHADFAPAAFLAVAEAARRGPGREGRGSFEGGAWFGEDRRSMDGYV